MVTDKIEVSSRRDQIAAALNEVEKTAVYEGLSPKGTLQLRLLTEEMMGMMRSLTGETEGRFWIENEGDEYHLHLLVYTIMDSEKRDQLLAASSTGKNESARGLIGRLRDFFDRGADADVAGMTSTMIEPELYGDVSTPSLNWEWSMSQYEAVLSEQIQDEGNQQAREAWDEMEKSVVAHVADEVRVSIRGREVEMIIDKKLN